MDRSTVLLCSSSSTQFVVAVVEDGTEMQIGETFLSRRLVLAPSWHAMTKLREQVATARCDDAALWGNLLSLHVIFRPPSHPFFFCCSFPDVAAGKDGLVP